MSWSDPRPDRSATGLRWFGSKGNSTASEPDSNAAFDVSDHRKGHS